MAAPNHVSRPPDEPAAYSSPPRRAGSWLADRPGEVVGHEQPAGAAMGHQGPDQGYVLTLMNRFIDRLVLGEGEHAADVTAGCAGVALRRASLFGRAPIGHDVTVALTMFGFLDDDGVDDDHAADVVEWRRRLFAGVSQPHHYFSARAVAALVPEELLRLAPDTVSSDLVLELRSRGRREP